MPPHADTTELLPPTWDAVLDGSVRFQQPRVGYRVNQDSVLLAAFAARGRSVDEALDLGAGVGVVALVLHRLAAARRVTLIECDASLAGLAAQNLLSMAVPGEVLVRDLELGLPEALANRAELVVTNPPFFAGERHTSEHPGRRTARHGELEPFLRAARAALAGSRARLVVAYPARALDELLARARAMRLVPKRLRLVHSFVERPARLALVELRLARPGGLVVEPPLVEWERAGVCSAELTALKAVDRK